MVHIKILYHIAVRMMMMMLLLLLLLLMMTIYLGYCHVVDLLDVYDHKCCPPFHHVQAQQPFLLQAFWITYEAPGGDFVVFFWCAYEN